MPSEPPPVSLQKQVHKCYAEFCVRGSTELSLAASSPGGKKGRSLWCLRSAASDQLSALWRVRMARAPCSARGEHSLACVSSLAARGGLGHAVLILPQETLLSKQLAHPASVSPENPVLTTERSFQVPRVAVACNLTPLECWLCP